MSVIGSGG